MNYSVNGVPYLTFGLVGVATVLIGAAMTMNGSSGSDNAQPIMGGGKKKKRNNTRRHKHASKKTLKRRA